MKQIKIGTCIQGPRAEEWLPGFLGKGFETFSLNFHMSLEGTDLEQLAGKTEKLLEGRPERIRTWEKATCNIGFHPRAWEAMFEEVKQDNFGLEWEPTHQMVQLIDPVSQLRKWCHKIVHVHGKDATIDWNAVRHGGISGAETFVWHRMPGFGNTNWSDIISILRANGYEDDICIEGYHDPVYSGEWEMTGQLHALRYLKWCRGGDYEPVPWEV